MGDVRILEIKQSVFADNDAQADKLRAENNYETYFMEC